MAIKIMLSNDVMSQVRSHLQENRKIAAIKLVREAGHVAGESPTRKIGLKEAKSAVDHMQGHSLTHAEIVPNWYVHSVIVSGPAGDKIELDIETLQMHFLTSLSTLGLREVARLTDLVEYINRWQSGETKEKNEDESVD